VTVSGVAFRSPRTVGLQEGQHPVTIRAADREGVEASLKILGGRNSAAQYVLKAVVRPRVAAPPGDVPAPVALPPPTPSPAAAPSRVELPTTVHPTTSSPRWKRTAGWSLLGAGVALAAVGVGMNVWAIDAADATSRYANPVDGLTEAERERRYNSAESDMKTRGYSAYALYGIGGAAAVAGIVLVVLDATSPHDPPPVALLPTAMPGGAGLFLNRPF